jgi:hypothetical protein
MRLAYIITCHKNSRQVLRLINRLNTPNNTIVLHISKTCEKGFYEEMKYGIKAYNNVFLCKREDGTHNGFGIVKGMINGLQLLFKKQREFEYVNLISGQDYPIKSNKEISNFFELNKGKQYLDFFPVYPKEWMNYEYDNFWGPDRTRFRVDRHHFKISGKVRSIPELGDNRLISDALIPTIKTFLKKSNQYIKQRRWWLELQLLYWSRVLPKRRKIPTDFEIFGSKTWWSISNEAAAFVLHEHLNNKRYQNFFKYTLIPDEMYVQTILLNSKFAETCINNDLRNIQWFEGDLHPVVFKAENIDRFKETTDLFARKFDIEVDSKILDLIDEEILDK